MHADSHRIAAPAGVGPHRGHQAEREVAGRHPGASGRPPGDLQGRGAAERAVRASGRAHSSRQPPRSTLNGPSAAACSSVKPCKNAANSGWRNSGSRIFSAMSPSSARAPEARRPPFAGLRKPPRDRSMLNPAAPDCNPRTQNPSHTQKREATRFHKKWDAPHSPRILASTGSVRV